MKSKPISNAPSATSWYDSGLRFDCKGCGNCCTGGPGYVWIDEREVARLADYLKITVKQVLERHCRRIGGRLSLKEHRNQRNQYDCIFLREEKVPPPPGESQIVYTRRTCTIYPVRPLQCRTWPFWDGLLAGRAAWDRAAQRCPGMNVGRTYSAAEIESIRAATDWPEKP